MNINGKLSTLALVFVTCYRLKRVRPNSRIVIPTGACVTSVLTIVHTKVGPIFYRPSLLSYGVTPRGVRSLVASQAGTVLPMRLCKEYTSVRSVGSVTEHRGLGIIRSTTRTRNTVCGKGHANDLKSTTKFDFCPTGGLNTLKSNNTIAAGSRSLTTVIHSVTGCNSSTGCIRLCGNVGDHLSRLRTTMLHLGLSHLSTSGRHHHLVTSRCVARVRGARLALPQISS